MIGVFLVTYSLSLSLSLSLSVLSWASFSDDLFVSIFCSAHFSLRHLTASITAFEEHQAETAESQKKKQKLLNISHDYRTKKLQTEMDNIGLHRNRSYVLLDQNFSR